MYDMLINQVIDQITVKLAQYRELLPEVSCDDAVDCLILLAKEQNLEGLANELMQYRKNGA